MLQRERSSRVTFRDALFQQTRNAGARIRFRPLSTADRDERVRVGGILINRKLIVRAFERHAHVRAYTPTYTHTRTCA